MDEIINYVITDKRTPTFQIQNADLYSKEYLNKLISTINNNNNNTNGCLGGNFSKSTNRENVFDF